MKTISVIILAVCIIAFLLDVLNVLSEKDREDFEFVMLVFITLTLIKLDFYIRFRK